MCKYGVEIKKLNERDIVYGKLLLVASTLAKFAKNNLEFDNVILLNNDGTSGYDEVHFELDRIISIAGDLIDTLDNDDKVKCEITDIVNLITSKDTEFSPELLSLYIVMSAFSDIKPEDNIDERISMVKDINYNSSTHHIAETFINSKSELDGSMWDLSNQILENVKENNGK